MKIYFDGKFTFDQYEAANKEYKRLAKELHPDTGGDQSTFQEMARQWRAWKKGYEARQNNPGIGNWFNETFRPHSKRQPQQETASEDVMRDFAEGMRRAQEKIFHDMFMHGVKSREDLIREFEQEAQHEAKERWWERDQRLMNDRQKELQAMVSLAVATGFKVWSKWRTVNEHVYYAEWIGKGKEKYPGVRQGDGWTRNEDTGLWELVG